MKTLGIITFNLFLILLALLFNLLTAYIILDIGKLLIIDFIKHYSLIQWFGIIFIARIIINQKNNSTKEITQKELFIAVIKEYVFLLAGWGIFYLFFNFFLK
jgi:hypothetical protein